MRRRGFNQADAARYMEFEQPFISQLLSGVRSPGLANAIKIERFSGIPVEAWAASELADVAEPVAADAGKPRYNKA